MSFKCPDIGYIKFSQTSIDAINDIRNRQLLSNTLLITMGGGAIINIPTLGSSLPETSFALYSTDFKAMADAMASVPVITRDRIEFIASCAQNDVKDYKEKMFWEAVRNGCSVGK
jgi:hypothetical protein